METGYLWKILHSQARFFHHQQIYKSGFWIKINTWKKARLLLFHLSGRGFKDVHKEANRAFHHFCLCQS
jgi:hypothetical protein